MVLYVSTRPERERDTPFNCFPLEGGWTEVLTVWWPPPSPYLLPSTPPACLVGEIRTDGTPGGNLVGIREWADPGTLGLGDREQDA
jgi:hypothetical protein